MFSVIEIIRLGAIVSLSAIKLISSFKSFSQPRNANNMMNNQPVYYNNRPMYNTPVYPVNNQQYYATPPTNQYCNTELRWNDGLNDSRRNSYSPPPPQPVYQPQPQPQQVYQPQPQVYQPPQPSPMPNIQSDSRRWNNRPTGYPQMFGNMYYAPAALTVNPYGSNQMTTFNPNLTTYNSTPELRWNNTPAVYVNQPSRFAYGYSNNNYTQQYPICNQELKWKDQEFTDPYRHRRWQPPKPAWNQQPKIDKNGIVPMFCLDDGTPLYGPVPV